MPKKTFDHLPNERKNEIRRILLPIFTDQAVSQVTVSEIVTALGMSRGIFYKYYEDLDDAYQDLIRHYAGQIHGKIIMNIMTHQNDFFTGIELFLVQTINLKADSVEARQVKLLTENPNNFSNRANVVHGLEPWKQILKNNHFEINTDEEATSFLYFTMKLTIDTLMDSYANHWTEAEMLTDYRFKVSWLKNGIAK
ncbi:TetR family transcriptional regulator [Secundilactobacillus malefermentans]|uniref:TetR family transcriptional regulator n=1 Tax=Secundilactobacillus malefermentans TaxID=176292 RepID=UPI0011CABC4F|nr:TetR family transcriptional regulator [Secundilactobacillus malefermentans]QEA31053.1 TetR/AcrR family transcriptional regulator [Secundilactobacillus malefermentans]